MPLKIAANGNIAAWQEASVGTEANGLRLAEVKVNVGDVVKRGQVLASFTPDTIAAELAQTRAAVAEAEATLAEASANAQSKRDERETERQAHRVERVEQPQEKHGLMIIFRVFDDGFAFRYVIPAQPGLGEIEIDDELSEFVLTGDHYGDEVEAVLVFD